MASDLFPIRRGRQAWQKNSSDGSGLLAGNPLSDAVLRAFRETFGLGVDAAAVQHEAANDTTPDGTIVPPQGETNP